MDYRLGLYEKSMPNALTLEEKLRAAGEAGFDFMELSVDESDEKLARLKWSASERLGVLRSMNETGIRIGSMCLSGHRRFPIGSEDRQIRARGMEIMRGAVGLASDLGVCIIQIAGYDEYYNPSNAETERLFAENLRESVEYAAKMGVTLAFETMETPFMDTVGKAMKYVSMINSPFLHVYPDLGNITNAALTYGHSVESDLLSGAGHIAALHLKESKPGVYREVPFGTGHVDFAGGIKTARSIGVRLFVGEFWHDGGDDWREKLREAHAFLCQDLGGSAPNAPARDFVP